MGSYTYKVLVRPVNSQNGHDGEKGEGRKPTVAEEFYKFILGVTHLHDHGLEQLDVVLDGLRSLSKNFKFLEEILV